VNKKNKSKLKFTRSISGLDSISYIVRDPTCLSLNLPQISLVHTNTMKVALNPNPIIVVTKLLLEFIIKNPTPPLHKTNLFRPKNKHKKLNQRRRRRIKKKLQGILYIIVYINITQPTSSKR